MLDLRRLEVLHTFAALGSITATAAELGYSASAISQQISMLEREAGIALVERTAHSAMLTDAGRELVAHAARILADVESAQSRMRARSGVVGGRVVVSCIPSLAAQLAPHLAGLQRQHADLSIVARETGSSLAAAAVLEGRADLAVVDDWSDRRSPQASGLAVLDLRREPVVLALAADHPEARRHGPVTAAALGRLLRDETWLCAPRGQFSREAGDRRLTELGLTPRRRWEFEGLHVQAALVAAGAGIALFPATVAAGEPGVAAVPLQPRMHRRVIAVTRSSHAENPAVVACLAAARVALHP